ncbi:MAG: DedA family protein [Candidatus Gastranaerophilales bacterium]|nr:DedA family protein [Candidatus Gastranaerophilales bacterium]
MIEQILEILISFIESTITILGPWGISLLMAIESCNIPLPSEAILPFAGYLVTTGKISSIHTAAVFGAAGCVIGSIPSYYLGYFGGRNFIEKYGKYFLISKHDLETADKWVDKYGNSAFFICRMLPVVRTFISLPAGILKAQKRTFFLLTFLGSLIWSYILVFVGIRLGENFETLKSVWHKFDAVIITIFIILGSIYIYKHIKALKNS